MMVVCGFENGPLGPQVALARRLGATHVELYPRWAAPPDPTPLGQELRDAGLTVWSAHGPWDSEAWHASRIDLGSLDPRLRSAAVQDIVAAVDWLATAGGRCLVVHPGVLSEAADEFARRDALLASLRELGGIAEQRHLRICVENMPPGCFPGSRMTDLSAIVTELDAAHVGLCLDTGHAHLVAGVGESTRAAGSRLWTTHVHDNSGQRDEHLAPGLGTLPWPELRAALDEIAYHGPIMLECPRYFREHPEVVTVDLVARLNGLCTIGDGS
jgi:sugar phosphate isomerase/epimerase